MKSKPHDHKPPAPEEAAIEKPAAEPAPHVEVPPPVPARLESWDVLFEQELDLAKTLFDAEEGRLKGYLDRAKTSLAIASLIASVGLFKFDVFRDLRCRLLWWNDASYGIALCAVAGLVASVVCAYKALRTQEASEVPDSEHLVEQLRNASVDQVRHSVAGAWRDTARANKRQYIQVGLWSQRSLAGVLVTFLFTVGFLVWVVMGYTVFGSFKEGGTTNGTAITAGQPGPTPAARPQLSPTSTSHQVRERVHLPARKAAETQPNGR